MTKRTKPRPDSERERERTKMIEAALARPGIRELMAVYDRWQEKDRGLDAYRAATKAAGRVTTTDSTKAP